MYTSSLIILNIRSSRACRVLPSELVWHYEQPRDVIHTQSEQKRVFKQPLISEYRLCFLRAFHQCINIIWFKTTDVMYNLDIITTSFPSSITVSPLPDLFLHFNLDLVECQANLNAPTLLKWLKLNIDCDRVVSGFLK